MHLGTPEMYPLPKEMEDAFDKADTLVVEVNINKIDQQKVMALVQAKGMYAGDETLPGNLKKETWTELKSDCETLGLPARAGIEKNEAVGLSGHHKSRSWRFRRRVWTPAASAIDKHFLDLAEKEGERRSKNSKRPTFR